MLQCASGKIFVGSFHLRYHTEITKLVMDPGLPLGGGAIPVFMVYYLDVDSFNLCNFSVNQHEKITRSEGTSLVARD